MEDTLRSLKIELKGLAEDIKKAKRSRKQMPHGYVPGLVNLQFEFRVMHIYRCLLRGKTIEQIENSRLKKPKDPNSLEERRLLFCLEDLRTRFLIKRLQCLALEG